MNRFLLNGFFTSVIILIDNEAKRMINYSNLNRWLNHQAETFAFSVNLSAKLSTLTCWTNEYHYWPFPYSSFLFLEILTLTLLGKFLIPWDQMNWLSLGSILTSSVFIILVTRVLIYLRALGAFFLNCTLWANLWILIVVSIAVSESPFLSYFFPITNDWLWFICDYLIKWLIIKY